jgi:hypothetical protein
MVYPFYQSSLLKVKSKKEDKGYKSWESTTNCLMDNSSVAQPPSQAVAAYKQERSIENFETYAEIQKATNSITKGSDSTGVKNVRIITKKMDAYDSGKPRGGSHKAKE